jgi:two-component system sensor histidine kinase UhpB
MIERAQDFLTPTILRYIRPNGSIVKVEHRNRPIVDDTGRVVAIEGIGRDVTASVAVNDRLRASQRQLRTLAARLLSARESERTSVARELHDELGQTLTTLKIDLTRSIRTLIPVNLDPTMIDRLQTMVGGIDLATETVRRLASALRPPALDHLGLAAAIELEGSALSRRTGLRCRVTGKLAPTAMTPEQTTAVFRIVQEALTNIVRHASASVVKILLRQTADTLSVKIQDNGRGMTRQAMDDPASIGLLGMRERAELIGGCLAISSRPGKGTAILITVPVTQSGKDDAA